MQWIKTSASALMTLAVALASNSPQALAQSADPANPAPPSTRMPDKSTDTRPGPLDVVVDFHASAANLDVGVHTNLDELATWLAESTSHSVTIEVHPDEAALVTFDPKLNRSRAEAIRSYLVGHGAGQSQIVIVSHGQLGAATTDATDRNRRAIFLMTSEDPSAQDSSTDTAAAASAAVTTPDLLPPSADRPIADAETLPVGTPMPDDYGDADGDDHLLTRFGMGISVGGGVVGFFDSQARDVSDVGGSWEARLTIGTRTPVAFEAAYIGSAQSIQALGLDNSAVLLGTAVEGDVRLNLTTLAVQPYIFGGLGYTRYDVTNEDFNTSSVNDEEQMGHVPLGAGLGFQWRGMLIDVRGTVRAAFNDDLLNTPADNNDDGEPDVIPNEDDAKAELDTWNLGARVGWEF